MSNTFLIHFGRKIWYTRALISRFLKNLEEIEPCVIHWSEWRASRWKASVSSFWHVRIISVVTHLLTRDVDKWISRWTERRGFRERIRREENLPGAPRTTRHVSLRCHWNEFLLSSPFPISSFLPFGVHSIAGESN